MDIDVIISTNYCDKDLRIEDGAIADFTRAAFESGNYSAKVIFECLPRAFNPDIIEFILKIKDIGEVVLVCKTVFESIISFSKKTRGYSKNIRVQKNGEELGIINVEDEMDIEDLQNQIDNLLNR